MKKYGQFAPLLLVLLLGVLLVNPADVFGAPPLPGAIFTTNVNGTRVNQSSFAAKCDVYLDGGPGPNAPQGAAGLPDGDYYFQVTDPSGKTLLSTDPVQNRKFHVAAGVITGLSAPGNHGTGIDVDHAAVTIQLCAFNDTPNNGGVYKVWVTPIEDFVGDVTKVDSSCGRGCLHGFVPAASKTDNFKVKGPTQPGGACLVVNKVLNGTWVGGWPFAIYDPLGTLVQGQLYTELTKNCIVFNLPPGNYLVVEELNGATPSANRLDGTYLTNPDDTILVKIKAGDKGSHEVVFYNTKP